MERQRKRRMKNGPNQKMQDEPERNIESFHRALELMQHFQTTVKNDAKKQEFANSAFQNQFFKNEINGQQNINRNTNDFHLLNANNVTNMMRLQINNEKSTNDIIRRLGFHRLTDLTTKDPSEILFTLNSPKSGFKELINSETIRIDMMINILLVLGKICEATEIRNLASLINQVVSESNFVNQHLQRYMIILQTLQLPEIRHINSLQNLVIFLLKFQEIQPATASEMLSFVLPVLMDTVNKLEKKGIIVMSSIHKKIEILQEKKDVIVQIHDQKTRERISDGEKLHAEEPPEDYQSIPILPTKEDFTNKRPFIRPNIIHGRYLDISHYLDVQFRLLREDYVQPLRESIKNYTEIQNNPNEKKLKKIRVYRNVHVLCPYNTEGGIVHLISFDVKPFSHIQWEVSKRLLIGSLLCLSSNNFETMQFATVAKRDPLQLKKGKIEIHFEKLGDEIFSIPPSEIFVMVESDAYFEAYRHTLTALQQIKQTELPNG